MSALARAHGAINLGQGFPDAAGPQSVRAAAADAVLNGPHHYPPMRGMMELRTALADFYGATQGLAVDAEHGTLVTSGATEALASAIFALVAPGDEVIILAPAYDAYAPLVRRAGAVPRFVTLVPPDFAVSAEALAAVVSAKTRAILVNDPVNPTGRMLRESDRAAIAGLALAHDLFVIADEVWEEVRPPGVAHVSLSANPLLADRVVKIGSAGKIFQATGWKVGWALAAAPLTDRMAAMHQYLTFTTPPALQLATAYGLKHERAWLEAMRVEMARSRALLAEALAAADYVVLPGEATWFLNIDLAASGITMTDRAFCRHLVTRHGVAAIPVSAFHEGPDAPDAVVRFCHAKSAATIRAAIPGIAAAKFSPRPGGGDEPTGR